MLLAEILLSRIVGHTLPYDKISRRKQRKLEFDHIWNLAEPITTADRLILSLVADL